MDREHGQLEELLTCTVITMTNYSSVISDFEPLGDYSSRDYVLFPQQGKKSRGGGSQEGAPKPSRVS
jgi:hypothetical protein